MNAARNVLITGAGRGIGRATAVRMAAAGHRVMAVARSEDQLRSLAGEHGVEYLVASVDTAEACERIVDETRARLGSVDVLVSNAGVAPPRAAVWEESPQVWRETMAVNLDAAFHLVRFGCVDMRARGWGRVVLVGSTFGLVGAPLEATYDSSKHALVGLTRSAAHDLGADGITCNIVMPGWLRTEMSERSVAILARRRGVDEDIVWRELESLNPARRMVTPEEVASVIEFLSSDAASGVSGEAIRVALGSVT